MFKKFIALGALVALAGPAQAVIITGSFSAAVSDVTSSTFGIGAGTTFTNQSGAVTSSTGEFSSISSGTAISLSSVTATIGTPVLFTSSFGSFIGNITQVATAAAPNARVGLDVLGSFTPTGGLAGFTGGLADLTLSFTQTGMLNEGGEQPAVSGSFTFSSPSLVGGVPEASTWAMLIAGFGMTGAAMRRRQTAVAA
jgi:hypothetical protein